MDKEAMLEEIKSLEIQYKQTRNVVEKNDIAGKIAAIKRDLSKTPVEKKEPKIKKDVPVVADHVDSAYDGRIGIGVSRKKGTFFMNI